MVEPDEITAVIGRKDGAEVVLRLDVSWGFYRIFYEDFGAPSL